MESSPSLDRNESTLGLSAVINLLQVLSSADRPQQADTALQRVPLRQNTPRLGDFTSLWNYLGHEPLTRASTPTQPLALNKPPSVPTTPESSSADDSTFKTSPEPVTPSPKPVLKKKPKAISINLHSLQESAKRRNALKIPQNAVKVFPKNLVKQPPPTPVLKNKKQKQSPTKTQTLQFTVSGLDGQTQGDTWTQRPVITCNVPSIARKTTLIKKLLVQFPQDAGTLAPVFPPRGPPAHDAASQLVHVFIDNSNIVIGYADLLKMRNGFKKYDNVGLPKLSFHNLSLILERGRPTGRKVLVGSHPRTPVMDEAELLHYENNILAKVDVECDDPQSRRGSGSSSSSSEGSPTKKKKKAEQGVDEILNLKMLETLLDYSVPTTIVLASGDGAVGQFSEGFFAVVERALIRGWAIELATFSGTMSKSYSDRAFRLRWQGQFRVIFLDDYVEELAG